MANADGSVIFSCDLDSTKAQKKLSKLRDEIVVYFTDFVLQLTLLFMILSWAEDSSSSHEIDSVEYRQWLLHVQNTLAFG